MWEIKEGESIKSGFCDKCKEICGVDKGQRYCHYCGTELSIHFRFLKCQSCHRPLGAIPYSYCSYCGAQHPSRWIAGPLSKS
mgnify:CR=1 FL=1